MCHRWSILYVYDIAINSCTYTSKRSWYYENWGKQWLLNITYFIIYILNYPPLSLNFLSGWFMVSLNGGDNTHTISSSLMLMSMKDLQIFQDRVSWLKRRKLGLPLSIYNIINYRQIRTRRWQVSSCIWYRNRHIKISTSGGILDSAPDGVYYLSMIEQ